jgi:hypothetical protein
MGRRRPAGRNIAHDVLVASHGVVSPALQFIEDYVARVRSHKDPIIASVNVLRELALSLSTTGMVVDSVYHRLLKEDLCTVAQLKSKDAYLVKFLDNNKQRNTFREFRLQYQMMMSWGENWEVKLGFGQVPCRDILEVCIRVAERHTMLEALDLLKKEGRELYKDGIYKKPTKVSHGRGLPVVFFRSCSCSLSGRVLSLPPESRLTRFLPLPFRTSWRRSWSHPPHCRHSNRTLPERFARRCPTSLPTTHLPIDVAFAAR